ncbi:alpha-glucosidase/alpha-galactosidase [Alkalicoccobacillus plakortidis]|uniref:Alpha-glucosidase/alpha-galactosidase n=1 Tax=Alkalicoccobacillus plakortidis TaxID=444060 RepID=A0ABT0XG25_9BACI|nr:alpha-glucosidase/alpha-galactosidase [Alkalicoccobacillus plakortidis]MCM2674650.1 alpha-glucosidase/alpha-galactosidase [Alkalicoccobacillus plakortidis]
MSKITFIGAGSTVFVKNVLGDCMLVPALQGFEFALYDIDEKRMSESQNLLTQLAEALDADVTIRSYQDRKQALQGAKYVFNAIQVGGYKPSTVIDFEIPKKYGLRQTIADTVGIGGIFRSLRTIPVMLDFARDIEDVAPDALFMNYTNPMATLMGALQQHSGVKSVGLCHSVQACTKELFKNLGMDHSRIEEKIAGINHMAWLLEVKQDGVDLYPEIKRKALEKQQERHHDMVRFKLMEHFGYYVTESSEHNAEYHPYFIKSNYPELIEQLNIPLDEYPRRCEEQIANWEKVQKTLTSEGVTHTRSKEYGSQIIEAIETNQVFKFGGNVLNTGNLITNLPTKATVEVPCIADRSGITPTFVGELPLQLAGLNHTNIHSQLLTIEAAVTKKRDYIYQAALLDPHTKAELSIDDIVSMCDELIEAHGDYLPKYQ